MSFHPADIYVGKNKYIAAGITRQVWAATEVLSAGFRVDAGLADVAAALLSCLVDSVQQSAAGNSVEEVFQSRIERLLIIPVSGTLM